MKPSQLIQFLARMFQARLPTMVVSSPGSGKTDCVEAARLMLGMDLILSHPAVGDPTDAKGLPWPNGEEARFLPFGDLARALRAERPTVWFLDDLGQAAPAVQAAYMQLLLARRVNDHVLPDCVTFVAATNRRTDRAGVSGILEPVKSRFVSIVELVADLDEWCDWALAQSWLPPVLVAFLRFKPDLLSAFEASADMTNSPMPRTWAHAGKILSLSLPAELEQQALAGAVGAGAAVELGAFLQMHRQLPSIDSILLDPDNAVIPGNEAALFAVCTGVAARCQVKSFGRAARYAERLTSAGKGEFSALLLRDVTRRLPAVMETKEFVALAAGETGQLLMGRGL